MSNFNDDRKNSLAWWNEANRLRSSAATLHLVMAGKLVPKDETACAGFPDIGNSFSVTRMLCGLSLEVIFKAIIVEEGNEPPLNHDLCKLAELAGLSYSSKEKGLLQLLRESIEWDGKYPVPKSESLLDKMCDLQTNVMFNAEPFGDSELKIMVPNENWGWEPYDRLYRPAEKKLIEIASWITR